MPSEATSGLVLFIVAITAAALAGGVMAAVIGNMTVELRARGDGLADAIGTDIAIINDPGNVPYDAGGGVLTLYVKNTGSTTLTHEEMTVMVDGVHAAFTATLLEGATSWSSGTVLELSVEAALAAGDHRARTVYTPSVSDDLEFRV